MRVHLGRPLTDVWVDHEVPVIGDPETTEGVNGPGAIRITVPSDYPRKVASDGHTFIHEWGALLVVEDDQDRIIQAGIVDQITPGPITTQVEAGGVSMVFTGAPYKGKARSLIETSVVSVARMLVDDYRAYDNGDIPLTVTGSAPGITVGVDSTTKWKTANTANEKAKAYWENAKSEQSTAASRTKSTWAKIFHLCHMSRIGKVRKGKTPPKGTTSELKKLLWLDTSRAGQSGYEKAGRIMWFNAPNKEWLRSDANDTASKTYTLWEQSKVWEKNAKAATATAKTAYDKTKEALDALSEEAAQPYTLTWWDTQDMSSVLADLVTAGAEWAEKSVWVGQNIRHLIEIRKPGQVRRENLRFEIGVNIQEEPEWAIGDPYTGVFVLGAGEGSKTVHTNASWDAGGRVRRVKVVSDQDQKTTARVQALAAKELAAIKKATAAQVTGITVTDHPFAHWSQYDVGDLIRVIGTMPGGWDVDEWMRITERTMTGNTDKVKLTLEATE